MINMEYPEHEKLKKVQKESQTCGELLEWLHSEKGIMFRRFDEEDEVEVPVYITIPELLAEFFGINSEKLEKEKIKMLDECRKLNKSKR